MKKKIIIFDNFRIFKKKQIILKNSLNYIFFKKLKNLYKKNLYINYFFYNTFINFYKNKNINIYLNSFFIINSNIFYIYNLNTFKKQFMYNLNFLKTFLKNKNLKFLFLRKSFKNNFYFNNCLFLNNYKNNFILDEEFKKNFVLIKLNNNSNYFNYFFINFNLFLFSLLEIYKILIFIYIKNSKLNKKYI